MRHTTIIASLLCLASADLLANETAQLPYDCELRNSESEIYCAKPGWYVHGAFGSVDGSSSIADFYDPLTAQGFDVSDIVIDDKRLGLKFNLGYSFTEHFGLELGYTDLGNVEVVMSALVANRDSFYRAVEQLHPTSARGITLSGVATLPLAKSLTLNGRMGLFKWQGDFTTVDLGTTAHVGGHDTEGTDLYYGIYGEFLMSKQTRLVFEWERYQFGDNDSDMLSFGVKHFFGRTSKRQATPIAPIVKRIKPTPPPVVVVALQELRLIVPFANDKSVISAEFITQLEQIGNKISGHSIETFTMAGHTSKIANKRYNQALSERRVNAIANYFIDQFSIKPSAITMAAFGEERLRDHRGTEAAAATNRRVEIHIKYIPIINEVAGFVAD